MFEKRGIFRRADQKGMVARVVQGMGVPRWGQDDHAGSIFGAAAAHG
jgi:hypothetical protein